MAVQRHKVLVADDYEADRFFLREAIRKHAPLLEVVAEVEDGDEVIAYLLGHDQYADRQRFPFPELLIMDVRMPRMTGIKVLEWLQAQNFNSLKIAMLADSSAAMFRDQALSLGLDHFYSKATDPEQLVEVVRRLQAELQAGTGGLFI